ncbi:MAG: ABC transporter permease, partial [Acidimicrobiia bacterium]
FEASFIEIFAAAAIDDINREILEEVVVAGQSETADVDQSLQAARAAVDAMSAANDRGEEISPEDQITLEQSLVGIAAVMASQSRIVSGVEEAVGADATTSGALNRAQENSTRLGESDRSPEETSASLSELSSDLDLLKTELAVFQGLEPRVLVSPFVSRIENAQGVDINFSHYYVPGVVSLLLQHLALTFAALSLVRERSLGTVELFRVSPLTGGEALAGKYLAYLMLGGLVSAALTVAAIGGFGFQIAGSPGWYLLSLLLVMVAALGGGFVLSAIARTESEAVQYAMIALLISIFFSGFFISLDRLIPPVRVISYLIPATYGIAALQDVAFLGQAPEPQIIGGSAALALLFVAAASLLIKTRVVGNGRLPLRRRRALRRIAQSAADEA